MMINSQINHPQSNVKVSLLIILTKKTSKKSVYAAKESEDITSIFINYPALLLRKKSSQYPDGRTSYRFKRALRKKVTIIDKTKHDNAILDGKTS